MWLVAGGWWLLAGGWWLVAGGWWPGRDRTDQAFQTSSDRARIPVRPGQTSPGHSKLVQTEPDQARPGHARPDQTKPDHDQTKPDQANPVTKRSHQELFVTSLGTKKKSPDICVTSLGTQKTSPRILGNFQNKSPTKKKSPKEVTKKNEVAKVTSFMQRSHQFYVLPLISCRNLIIAAYKRQELNLVASFQTRRHLGDFFLFVTSFGDFFLLVTSFGCPQ